MINRNIFCKSGPWFKREILDSEMIFRTETSLKLSTSAFVLTLNLCVYSGATVGRRTCDQEVAGSIPWASCSHPLASSPTVLVTAWSRQSNRVAYIILNLCVLIDWVLSAPGPERAACQRDRRQHRISTDLRRFYYRAMLCMRSTSHGPLSVSVCVYVCHKLEFLVKTSYFDRPEVLL